MLVARSHLSLLIPDASTACFDASSRPQFWRNIYRYSFFIYIAPTLLIQRGEVCLGTMPNNNLACDCLEYWQWYNCNKREKFRKDFCNHWQYHRFGFCFIGSQIGLVYRSDYFNRPNHRKYSQNTDKTLRNVHHVCPALGRGRRIGPI